MSTYETESQDGDGIADETKCIDVAGGTLVYRIERERVTDGGPDHDVPVNEQLTARQRELVGRDGGGE